MIHNKKKWIIFFGLDKNEFFHSRFPQYMRLSGVYVFTVLTLLGSLRGEEAGVRVIKFQTSTIKKYEVTYIWYALGLNPLDTGRKLNVDKTFRRRPGRLLKVLYAFNLSPVPTGNGVEELLFFVDVIFCMALKWKRAISKSSYASDLLCGRDWASLLNIIPFLDSCHISWRKYFRK